MNRANRPTNLIMDIEDIRLSLQRLTPSYPGYALSSSDSEGAPGGEDTHQIEINIENFVATFKKTCPDWESHFTRVESSYSVDLNENNDRSDSLVTSTDSVALSSSSASERSGGSYGSGGSSVGSRLGSVSTSTQNLLMICGPEFLNIPTVNSQHYLLNPGRSNFYKHKVLFKGMDQRIIILKGFYQKWQ